MTDSRRVVIVGGSLAGLKAAQEARTSGFTGRLTIVGAELHLPYDRPPLSKEFLGGSAAVQAPFLPGAHELAEQLGVETILGEPATAIDMTAQRITVGTSSVAYDSLLVATGSTARRLGDTDRLRGVETLRTLDDAQRIGTALRRGDRPVVIGGGFIGSEVASAARSHGLDVSIIEAAPTPLVRAVGETAGEWLSRLHARNGTQLICGTAVESLSGDERVEAIHLSDGRSLDADLVVVGIGADPATGWLDGSGLELDNGIVCDARLRAGDNIWAAGDVARWWSEDFGAPLRIEHWTNAAEQGAVAMRNLLNPQEAMSYRHIPYFWSDWYGSRIQLVGLASGEPTVVTGDPATDVFVALYREGDRLVGALALNRRSDIMKYRALIARSASWQDGLALAEERNRRMVRA
ncbi:NAD(P)/FAD-dependent oxidoreductase [Gordonia rhizosphera]|uniref:Putative ferredoxin reductase n=1 Tax=Gordonia rhizosphera NBRC 16068 TaxID=1108045 RepID=K6X4I8_9ACTN|nr:FAD-dependent oxidoreductase [Gordonia rhizosphera]GAB93714.1 putative ferredoxin reductase [Gordonia rhizosphera NBRC 16068]